MLYISLPPGLLLALVGVTIVATRGSIFRWLHEGRAGAFFKCPLCVGFWVGALGSLVLRPWSGAIGGVEDAFLDGASVAVLSYLVGAVLIRLLDGD